MASYNTNRAPLTVPTALNIPMDCEDYIPPRKLINPIAQSPMHQAMNREMKVNARGGRLFKNTKSELQKCFDKKQADVIEPKKEPKTELTELDRMLNRMYMIIIVKNYCKKYC